MLRALVTLAQLLCHRCRVPHYNASWAIWTIPWKVHALMTRDAILNELPPPWGRVIKEAMKLPAGPNLPLRQILCCYPPSPCASSILALVLQRQSPAEDAALAEDGTAMLAIFLASRSALLVTYLSCSLTCTNA